MKLTAAATVIPVSDLEAALRFYVETLGFRKDFVFGSYAGVERDNCLLHLSKAGNSNTRAPGSATVYLFCDSADEVFADLQSHGAAIKEGPKDWPYGMPHFALHDPDGNTITFGSPTKE